MTWNEIVEDLKREKEHEEVQMLLSEKIKEERMLV